jgi:putative ABC transport system permease protein
VGIVIACLGLLGLVSHAVVRRTKEIGVRKVLGANAPGIVGLVTKEFLKLVLLANIIAFPIAYFLMKKWLDDFAYKVGIDPYLFVLAGIAALVVAFLTISVQAIRAAHTNPVESLRYE